MAKSKTPSKGDYAVGKGKPPRHTQWPKGVSGNPGGKKKAALDLARAFEAALQRPIIVTIEGEKREISSLEAIVMRLVEGGLKGDLRAINSILDRSSLLHAACSDDQKIETSEDDLAILQRVLADGESRAPRKRRRKAVSVQNEGAQRYGRRQEDDND